MKAPVLTRSFWWGAGAGLLLAVLYSAVSRARSREPEARPRPSDEVATRQLREELAAAREELARAREEAARELAAARALSGTPAPEVGRVARPASAARPEPEALERVPGLEELLARGDLRAAAELLSATFEQGALTELELMQLAVEHPELVVAGINAFDLPDAFRAVLIDTLASLADPLRAFSGLDLEHEPNARFSARIAAFLAQSVERAPGADARAVPAIERLLAGNEMLGEKVNLYPVLAQLAAQGDARARELLEAVDVGAFAPGLRSLLDPPARDERGAPLTGALVYSVQYNKGRWENRPRQLESGDIVVSIGGERVASAADFARLVKQHHGLGALDFVEAGVFRPSSPYAGQFAFSTLQLDPGDLQLLYGVYTVKRP